jgi:hypothetical protein
VPPSGLCSCTIELEKQGAKMKIHLARPDMVDLVALSRSFWEWKGDSNCAADAHLGGRRGRGFPQGD